MRLFNELNDDVLPDRRRADSHAASPVASGDHPAHPADTSSDHPRFIHM
jgi:hypothetical protein